RIGNFKAEIGRIAGDVPFLQARIQPFLQLVGHFVLQRAGAGPVFQKLLEIRQFEEVMLGFFFHRRGAGNSGKRIFQFSRGVGGTAGFTVIAVLVASATFRALTFNVTVGQKQLFHRIVQLFDFAYGNMAFITAGFVDPLGEITVFFAVGAVEVIEGHLKTGEIGFVLGFYPFNQLFRSNALFFGTQHNGGAMSIVGANVVTLV